MFLYYFASSLHEPIAWVPVCKALCWIFSKGSKILTPHFSWVYLLLSLLWDWLLCWKAYKRLSYKHTPFPSTSITGTSLEDTSYLVLIWFNFYFVLEYSYLQYCASFRCIAEWLSYAYTCIHSLSDSFPIWVITEYWVEFPVLYGRSLLVICFIYRSCCCYLAAKSYPNLLWPHRR